MGNKFEDYRKRLSPTLRRIARRLNGHFSFFDEEDLFQEAITHLWLLSKADKLAGNTDSYILQGCYFHLRNLLRKITDKAKLVSLYSLSENGDASLEEKLAAKDPADKKEMEERVFLASAAVDSLTAREKRALSLLLNGMTVREIGSKMGISHVMVIKLRKQIQEKCARGFYDKYGA